MLEGTKGSWVDDLPGILWSIRNTTKEGTGQTPFALVYGSDAVFPVEVGIPSPRVTFYDFTQNDQMKPLALDLLPEIRGNALLRSIAYKKRITRYFNKRVKKIPLAGVDWVLRKCESAGKPSALEKLSPN
ncbi:uncharacterized protein LOC110684598 [Chenopodium quinoa]|uniref:uncharacterized protein LOC110684598 n=1 Tax=Chenopodium quinoa TaxID=63459 RepID=UPI000B78CB22|nr:uncharacterized protein LOC110684598 [Chenopodium quinoa]